MSPLASVASQTASAAAQKLPPDERGEAINQLSVNQGSVIRSLDWFKKHPVYEELHLAVLPAQLAALKRLGELALKDPLFVTRQGVIIDGYARKEYADILNLSTLPCVVFDIGAEEALRMTLNRHRRSPGWNDYNRILMASRLKDIARARAKVNQQIGGQLKGSSNLTEASVRKEIAEAAGVSEGNVTKVEQLRGSDSEVLNALAKAEIRIHRAWLWRGLSAQQQREELKLYRLKRGLKQPAKIRALRLHAKGFPPVTRTTISMGDLEQLLGELSSTRCGDCESSDSISVGLINDPSKAALLTTTLYKDLLARRSVNHHATLNSTETVP